MGRRVSIALVALAVAGGLACKKAAQEPVAPPAQAGPSLPPRFDGVYAAEVQGAAPPGDPNAGSVDFLRFTAEGRVMSLSAPASQSAAEAAVKLLMSGSDRAASGTYAIKDGVLRFVLTSKVGSMEYAGAIVKDDQLMVRWHSSINDASVEQTFTFVLIDPARAGEKSTEPPIEPADDGGAPAPLVAGSRAGSAHTAPAPG